MSVIDAPLRFSQCQHVLTADDIREELIRQLDAGRLAGVAVAAALGIATPRVTEMRKRERRVQQQEMQPLAELLGMVERIDVVERAPSNATIVKLEGAALEDPDEDLPVWGSALGAAKEVDGEAIEQTMLNTGDTVEYVKRPTILKGRAKSYAIYIQGSSMHPALPDGEMAVAVADSPLAIGDNVVVYLRPVDADLDDGSRSRCVLVKELVRRTARYVELRQYQPEERVFRIDMAEVLRIDRILTRKEMLS